MRFDLAQPCKDCPFLKKGGIRLRRARIVELAREITAEGRTFTCHKTTVSVEDGEGNEERVDGPNAQHCAGALLFCRNLDAPPPRLYDVAVTFHQPVALEQARPRELVRLRKRVFASVAEMLETAVDGVVGTGEPCGVADARCEHPAGWRYGGGPVENPAADAPYECAECGMPTCGPCSREVRRKRRRVRVCNVCLEAT